MHDRLLRRLIEYRSRFNPLGSPSDQDLERLRSAMAPADRDMAELEMVYGYGGVSPTKPPSPISPEALASIPEQLERGFTTICIKPSLFIDDPSEMRSFRDQVVERVSRGER